MVILTLKKEGSMDAKKLREQARKRFKNCESPKWINYPSLAITHSN